MERIFVDTAAWIALANAKDPDHEAMAEALASWNGRLVTTNFVLAETVTVALYRFGHKTARKLGTQLWDGDSADIVRVGPQDERDAWALFQERADKAYSFTDCASFVVMRRLRLTTAATVDDDFRREGFETIP